ncbi:putative RDD family membrane protein YckC [Paenibacillus cellulosilyticus]|uniref:Putative RDD family membrane protein YckC n=1 Tax=Paenibacillus cellulosilyticus TaxID=375489 RepID=A0A2V2YQ30_9BACL|nr:RDD family protein [Paenibacillus cellulosilyticus]PWV98621.1 putative RDD family membrane protein YckC [Paenibacillus cellulosilyticus]QKS43861.1 RDD family protein [Paenibacillus cellulosilyticus]
MEHIPERTEKEFAFTPVDDVERWNVAGDEPDAESIVSRYSESIFARRLGAIVIDNLIVAALLMGVFMLYTVPQLTNEEWNPASLLLIGLAIGVVYGYFVLLEAFFGSTVGKWALQIRVVKMDRSAPGFGRALLRSVIKTFESSILMLCGIVSVILILVTRKKQRLGDMAAGTFVLRARDAKPLDRGRLAAMRALLIVLSVTAVMCIPISISGMVKLAASPQTFETADGQYQLQAPSSWDAEDTDGELYISNFLSDESVIVGSDDEYTLDGWVTLEEYHEIILDWLPEAIEAELDGGQSEAISLNGHPAYRFTMNGRSDGERQAYNVTVTGDEDKYYFIVAWVSKTDNTDRSVEQFRQDYQHKLEHLDEIVGTFKSVRGLVSI